MQSYGSITITDLTDKSVKSVYAFYKSTSSAQAPATPTAPQEGAAPSGWSPQVTTSSSNPYAWMIIITYYTDGDPYVSQPSQVGNHASSITNVTNEIRYAKGDSSTNPPQTGWQVDPDTTSTTYPYLWTRITPIVTIDSTPSRLAPSYMVSVPIEGISENAVKSTAQLWRTSSTEPVVPIGHQSSRITISTTDYSSGWNPMSPVDSSSGTVVNFSNLWYITETQYLDGTYEYTQPQRDANYHIVNAIGVFKNDLASDSGSTIINGGHITTNSIKAAQIDVNDLTTKITTIGDPTKEHFTISGNALKAYNNNGNQYFSVSADGMTYGNSTNQQTVASQSYAQTQASTAKNEAISAAATDAETKANTAKNEAISAAESYATTKANEAKNEAISNTDTKLEGYTPTADLSDVALSGNYQDLDNQPTIPSKTSDLTNDSDFQTLTDMTDAIDTAKEDAINTAAEDAKEKVDNVQSNVDILKYNIYGNYATEIISQSSSMENKILIDDDVFIGKFTTGSEPETTVLVGDKVLLYTNGIWTLNGAQISLDEYGISFESDYTPVPGNTATINLDFRNGISDNISDLESEVSNNQEFVEQYLGQNGCINQVPGGDDPYIEIISGNGGFSLQLHSDKLSFMDHNLEVAYLSNRQLYINESTITQQQQIGNFIWVNRGGRLTLKHI